jgi:long-chain fatty acid transport protein
MVGGGCGLPTGASRPWRSAGLLALLLGAVAGRAGANPVDAFGMGSRGIALGGAHTALAHDVSANYYNPAGVVARKDLSIEIGYLYAAPTLRLNGRDLEVDVTRGLTAGVVAPGAIGPFRFAFGVALFLPDERVSRVRAMPREQPQFMYYDNRPQRVYLATNLAVQIVPGLYIGGGATFMSRTKGSLELGGQISFPDPEAESDLRLDLDVDLKALRYPQAGILWEPVSWLSVGLTYRHRFVLELKQEFRIAGNVVGQDGGGTILRDGFFGLTSYSTNLFQPRQVALGLGARPGARWLLAFDLVWAQWSEFINPGSRLQMDFDLGPFTDLVDMGSQPNPPSPRYTDTFNPRFGVEWIPWKVPKAALALRLGYAFEPSPAPPQRSRSMNLVDNHKHHLSAGLGIALTRLIGALDRPFELDLHFAYLHMQRRAHRKLDPADPVGDYVSDGFLLSMGITMRLRFQ